MLTVVNFAHGAFFMVGAFVGLYFLGLTGNFWFSLVLTPLVVGAIGLVAPNVSWCAGSTAAASTDPLLLTFGLSWVLIEAMRVAVRHRRPAVVDAGRTARRGRPGHRLLSEVPAVPDLRHRGGGAGALAVPGEDTLRADRARRFSRDGEIVQGAGRRCGEASGWMVFGIGTAIAGLSGVLAAHRRVR